MSPKSAEPLQVTTELAPFAYQIPLKVADILSRGGSAMGYSAVSAYMTCPEYSRLRALGVRRRPPDPDGSGIPPKLEDDPLTWGSIIHSLRATRLVAGSQRVYQLIQELDLCESDRLRLIEMWKIYDYEWPLERETFKYLGVECQVNTDIGDGAGGSLIRTVIYDSVILAPDAAGNPGLYSFECKSAARSGGQFSQYKPQFLTQQTLWNENPALVSRYGPMLGVFVDGMIKTQIPKAERVGPHTFSKHMERLCVDYMRAPEKTFFPANPDGSFTRMLHSCWGKYRPCEYIPLCWEDERGSYTANGEVLR